METRITASLPDVTAVSSAPRPTATPASIPFADILAGTVVRGAEGAVNVLPGGPLMAVALRGGLSGATTHSISAGSGVAGLTGSAGTAGAVGPAGSSSGGLTTPVSTSPEGPTTSTGSSTLGQAMTGAVNGVTGTSADGTGSIDSSLAQSQQQNMYYLQVQEQVNQENRSFSTMSNVLKAEHDTMKTAIGNIH